MKPCLAFLLVLTLLFSVAVPSKAMADGEPTTAVTTAWFNGKKVESGQTLTMKDGDKVEIVTTIPGSVYKPGESITIKLPKIFKKISSADIIKNMGNLKYYCDVTVTPDNGGQTITVMLKEENMGGIFTFYATCIGTEIEKNEEQTIEATSHIKFTPKPPASSSGGCGTTGHSTASEEIVGLFCLKLKSILLRYSSSFEGLFCYLKKTL